ncbi:MAG: thioredoxin domain-containing protein [Proteobacteria bacterium]|nr:thioredoxin domain-containing protein [Pseudomonadota bacterium]
MSRLSMNAGHNRLGEETSPYLLQHKDNPVHWWPWSDAAFAEAKARGVPVLLSVGYSACHWCHVMAHECFENAAIAAEMNRSFVNIKVDREERPDVDAIYQKALALIGEQGGWPLTMFVSPDGKPFFGGTYFPPAPAYGRPSLPQVLAHVEKVWRERKDEVTAQGEELTQSIGAAHPERLRDGLSFALLEEAAVRLLDYVDFASGGMNGAPKFPMPFVFEFLWRAFIRTGNKRFEQAVITTLAHLCEGGIYDHLAGGFARYSTDSAWLVPHFEKMLYDNAQLIDLMTLVWQHSKDPLLAARVRETVGWLSRDMIGETGAFTAAVDADSEGEEGKFYIWTEAEIDTLLGADSALFKKAYGVTPDGNWEGHNILNRLHLIGGAVNDDAALANGRAALLAARTNRVPPSRDDKILADWNGLTIAALAHAGMAFNESSWTSLACEVFEAILRTMTWTDETGRKRLGHSFCRGRLQTAAMLDDYANMINAALALHAATGAARYLAHAETWIELTNALYWDANDGGYFFTAADAHDLVLRTKSANDSAVPSGNGGMVFALARIFYLTGKQAYRIRAKSTVDALEVEAMKSFPHGVTLLNGFELLERAVQVVIVGDRRAADTTALLAALAGVSVPNMVLDVVLPETLLPDTHPAHGKTAASGAATAYVCRGPTCSPPQTSVAGLIQALTS